MHSWRFLNNSRQGIKGEKGDSGRPGERVSFSYFLSFFVMHINLKRSPSVHYKNFFPPKIRGSWRTVAIDFNAESTTVWPLMKHLFWKLAKSPFRKRRFTTYWVSRLWGIILRALKHFTVFFFFCPMSFSWVGRFYKMLSWLWLTGPSWSNGTERGGMFSSVNKPL